MLGTDPPALVGSSHAVAAILALAFVTSCNQSAQVVTCEDAFNREGCSICHSASDTRYGPQLRGIIRIGDRRTDADGATVVVTRQYVRESIEDHSCLVLHGYASHAVPPVYNMPRNEVDAIVSYVLNEPCGDFVVEEPISKRLQKWLWSSD